MIRINLIPVKVTKKKVRFMNQIYVGIFVLILTFVGVGWTAYSMKKKIKDKDAEIVKNRQELDKYKQIQKDVKNFQEQSSLLKKKIQVIEQLETGRNFHILVMDQISQSIPGNVWINSISYSSVSASKKSGGSEMSIRGSSYEKDAVGHFISNLQNQKDIFTGVSLGSLTKKSAQGGVDIYNYDLKVSLKYEVISDADMKAGAKAAAAPKAEKKETSSDNLKKQIE